MKKYTTKNIIPITSVSDEDVKRFQKYFKQTDGCWEWEGALAVGYGCFKMNGKHMKAHRVSYVVHNGELDKSSVVMHTCDNRACVNPKHLKKATQKENIIDCHMKGRASTQRGEESGTSKLTEKNARSIKKMLAEGVKQDEIAKTFGIHQSTVSNILSGRTWKHI